MLFATATCYKLLVLPLVKCLFYISKKGQCHKRAVTKMNLTLYLLQYLLLYHSTLMYTMVLKDYHIYCNILMITIFKITCH